MIPAFSYSSSCHAFIVLIIVALIMFLFCIGSLEAAKSSEPATLSESDQKTTEKVRLLKEKISSNIALMPIVLNRMRECMSKIDKLDSSDQVIHPAFKRKKTR